MLRILPWIGCCLISLCLCRAARAQSLPPPPEPPSAPTTYARVQLGKILFWDEQLSSDHSVACGTCHRPEAGGSDPRSFESASLHPGVDHIPGTGDDVRGSPSVVRCGPDGSLGDDGLFFPERVVTRRRANGFIGSQWDPELFWDGRASGVFRNQQGHVVLPHSAALESQAAMVLESSEMGCEGRTFGDIVARLEIVRPLRLATDLPSDTSATLALYPDYPSLFEFAFGDPAITRERIAMAIAAYERALIPDQTPYDAFAAGQSNALTPSEHRGLIVIVTHYCVFCHVPPLFTNHGFHNIGVRPPSEDPGRAVVTGSLADRGRFKVPSLRNVGLRAPYFRNGSASTIDEVMAFYERGGDFAENRDPIMAPLVLTPLEHQDAVSFLSTGLTDPRCAQRLPPFDRPTLASERAPAQGAFGSGSQTSTGQSPRIVFPSTPMIGSSFYPIGLANVAIGESAGLLLSTAQAVPLATIGPHPLFVDLGAPSMVFPLIPTTATSRPGIGLASMALTIPDDPSLAGQAIFAQWLVTDQLMASGFAVSDGLAISLFAP